MTAAACHILAKRGLTLADIQFLDHLIECGGAWRLTEHLTPDVKSNGGRGTAPLARLILKLRCGRPGECDAALLVLTNGKLAEA